MIHLTTRTLLAMALSLGTLAPTAAAGDWGISFGNHGRRRGITVHVGSHSRGYTMLRTHRHGRLCRWEPAHHETVQERVWVAGYSEKVWVPDEYEITGDAYGNEFRRLITRAHYDIVQHPGYYEIRTRQIHVPARQVCNGASRGRYGYGSRRH